jgi:glycolate oxidase FAD binding subunit
MSLRARIEEIVGREGVGELSALPGVPLAAPGDEAAAAELFELASGEGLGVALCGSGTKLGWALASRAPDLLLSTRRLAGVVEFEPGDGVVTARAGTLLADLRALVAAEGLELTPDVPRPERATLGGVIGAGQSGPDRLLHGPTRHQVLGTRSLRPTGELTRSGGRLVKNVSGYDVHRLLTGSHGSLGLVLEASLRLATAPERRVTVTRGFDDLAVALEAAASVRTAGIAPRSLTVENALAEGWRLHASLGGRSAHVGHELERLRRALGGELDELEDEPAAARADRVRDLEPDGSQRPALRITAAPARIRAAAGELLDHLPAPHEATVVVQPGVACLDLELTAPADSTLIELLPTLRAALRPLQASASLRLPTPAHAADLADDDADPVRLTLQERLRATFDPRDLLPLRPPLGGLR